MKILISNKCGFTLIEVLAAMVIMMVGLLGLLQSINAAIDHNTRNHLRDEATSIGERAMSQLRAKPYDMISASYPLLSMPSTLRGVAKSYQVKRLSTNISTDSKELQVIVTWKYRNMSTQHLVKSIRTR